MNGIQKQIQIINYLNWNGYLEIGKQSNEKLDWNGTNWKIEIILKLDKYIDIMEL